LATLQVSQFASEAEAAIAEFNQGQMYGKLANAAFCCNGLQKDAASERSEQGGSPLSRCQQQREVR
jgi:hypothetical protein